VALPVFSAFHASALTERSSETIDHVVFAVRTTDAMRADFTRPGQFVKMRVRAEDGVEHEGIFALATAPFESRFAFLARTNNPAGGEAADRIARMPMSAPLEITMPAGDGFALEHAHGRDLALVAVGTAIAPVRSVLETILRDRASYRAISLDYGLRSPTHLPFARDVDRWRESGVQVSLHVGHVRDDASYAGVRAQDALFERVGAAIAETVVLAVGHDALVREVRSRHAAAGGDPALVLHNY
jgi:ferredoxin-NADP reductase